MRQIVLLRGINLGPRNRVAMPALRELLSSEGFEAVRTYVQSGNIVLKSELSPDELERRCECLIEERLELAIAVLARTRDELADVVRRNRLKKIAENPKRYQVSFLRAELKPDVAEKLIATAVAPEQVVIDGREIYAWHPEGVARSKLWARIAGKDLGVAATARNWTTVTTLLAMADE